MDLLEHSLAFVVVVVPVSLELPCVLYEVPRVGVGGVFVGRCNVFTRRVIDGIFGFNLQSTQQLKFTELYVT